MGIITPEALFGFGSLIVSILVAAVTIAKAVKSGEAENRALLKQLNATQARMLDLLDRMDRRLERLEGLAIENKRLHEHRGRLCALSDPETAKTRAREIADAVAARVKEAT